MSSALSNRTTGQMPAILGSLVIGIIVLGPVLWAFATSFKTEVEAVVVPPTLWPNSPTLENYTKVLKDAAFFTDLWNSVAYSVGAVIIALLVGIPAGYAAARFSFKGKRALMLVVLATSMVPGVALLVPTYYLLETVGLLNSGIVVTIILSARIIPQTVWFIANFVEAVPVEIEDSAMIDGASRFQIIWALILPLIPSRHSRRRDDRHRDDLERLYHGGGLCARGGKTDPAGRPCQSGFRRCRHFVVLHDGLCDGRIITGHPHVRLRPEVVHLRPDGRRR